MPRPYTGAKALISLPHLGKVRGLAVTTDFDVFLETLLLSSLIEIYRGRSAAFVTHWYRRFDRHIRAVWSC